MPAASPRRLEAPAGNPAEPTWASRRCGVGYSAAKAGRRFRHVGFFYRTEADYASTVADFLRAALAAGEAAFAAVSPAKASLIRDVLGPDARDVEFVDMATLGRNPGRIIPHLLTFLGSHAGHVRWVGELVWAAHGPAGIREASRHESLMNLAFAQADVEILCPYDLAELDPSVIADARRTHPQLLSSGRRQMSPEYAMPTHILTDRAAPLPGPAGDPAYQHTYRTDLSQVRALVEQHAKEAGLSESRASDLVLAVSEVAANTLRHTRSSGTLTLWRDEEEVVCEIRDEGVITDPLVGRHRPGPDALGGHGLWLVHQVCDLVELNSDETGTTIRMHMLVTSAPAVG